MKNTENILSIIHLKKYFPIAKSSILQKNRLYVRANEDITLNIRKGETLGIVGESGSGKSTLGRTILGLHNQTAGLTMYYGKKTYELAPNYVEYTLRNSKKVISGYLKKERRVKVLSEECCALGYRASFFKLQKKILCEADANTARLRIAQILGGIMTLDDPTEGAELLLKKHLAKVEMENILKRIKFSEDSEKNNLIKELEDAYHIYEAESRNADRFKLQYINDRKFQEYEKYLDDGIDLSRLSYSEMRILRKDLQIIFQDPYSSLNPRMTVGSIIEEGLITHGFFKHGSSEMREYILDIMHKCGLQDYMINRYPHQFSGGQRQRICIARALALKPEFVVCDECVSALDVSIQSQIINLLEELKENEELTYLFISHDLAVVKYISDRIAVMYLGDIVEIADSDKLFKDPRHPYTIALISSIPTTDKDNSKREKILLSGSVPSPVKPPSGCKFHTRCYMATDKCREISPSLEQVGIEHYAACHYAKAQKVDANGEILFDIKKINR